MVEVLGLPSLKSGIILRLLVVEKVAVYLLGCEIFTWALTYLILRKENVIGVIINYCARSSTIVLFG